MLSPYNLTARYFGAGVSGWLRNEIIRMQVNDKSSANDLGYSKPIGVNSHERIAMIAKERGQIACMHGVRTVIWIIVITGIRKWILRISCTRFSFMYMERIYICRASRAAVREPLNLGYQEYAGLQLIEIYHTVYRWII